MNIIAKRQTITTNNQKLYHEKPYDIGYKAKPDYYVIFILSVHVCHKSDLIFTSKMVSMAAKVSC